MTRTNSIHRLIAGFTCGAFATALARPAAASDDAPPSTLSLTLRSDAPGTKLQRLAGAAEIYLGRHTGSAELWTDLCAAPCNLMVTRSDRLRVAGDEVETSALDLRPYRDHAAVSIHAGAKQKRAVGGALSAFGFLAALTGASLLGAAAVVDPPSTDPFAGPAFASINAQQADQASTLRAIGIISLVTGGLGLLIGIPTFAANRTEVTVD